MATDDAQLRDFFSRDPEVLKAAVAREQGVLEANPADGREDIERLRAGARWKIGEALFRLGRMREAVASLEEAERSLKHLPNSEAAMARVESVRGGALLVLKRYDEAARVNDGVVRLGKQLQEPYYVRKGSYGRAAALSALGRRQEASAAAAVLLESIGPDPEPSEQGLIVNALIIQASAAREAGCFELGLSLIGRALKLARQREDREPLCNAMRERAEVLYSAGRLADARLAYAEVIAEFRGGSEEFAWEAVWTARARRARIWLGLGRRRLRLRRR